MNGTATNGAAGVNSVDQIANAPPRKTTKELLSSVIVTYDLPVGTHGMNGSLPPGMYQNMIRMQSGYGFQSNYSGKQ